MASTTTSKPIQHTVNGFTVQAPPPAVNRLATFGTHVLAAYCQHYQVQPVEGDKKATAEAIHESAKHPIKPVVDHEPVGPLVVQTKLTMKPVEGGKPALKPATVTTEQGKLITALFATVTTINALDILLDALGDAGDATARRLHAEVEEASKPQVVTVPVQQQQTPASVTLPPSVTPEKAKAILASNNVATAPAAWSNLLKTLGLPQTTDATALYVALRERAATATVAPKTAPAAAPKTPAAPVQAPTNKPAVDLTGKVSKGRAAELLTTVLTPEDVEAWGFKGRTVEEFKAGLRAIAGATTTPLANAAHTVAAPAAVAPTVPVAAPKTESAPAKPLPTDATLAAMSHQDVMKLGAAVVNAIATRHGLTPAAHLATTAKAVLNAVKPAPVAPTLFVQDGKGGFRPATLAEAKLAVAALAAAAK